MSFNFRWFVLFLRVFVSRSNCDLLTSGDICAKIEDNHGSALMNPFKYEAMMPV